MIRRILCVTEKAMTSTEYLLKRVSVFDGSQEIADALGFIAESLCAENSYWLKEAEVHIEGLFDLTLELAEKLGYKYDECD